jgi:hypothetical protein
MKRKEHVEENLKVAAVSPAGKDKIEFLFSEK